jgi:hypothetical protein
VEAIINMAIIRKFTHNGRKGMVKETHLTSGEIIVGAYYERQAKAIPGTEGRLSAEEAKDAGWAKIKLGHLHEIARTTALRHGRR